MKIDLVGGLMLGTGVLFVGMVAFAEMTKPSRAEKIEAYEANMTAKQLPCLQSGGTIELVATRFTTMYCVNPNGTKLRIYE